MPKDVKEINRPPQMNKKISAIFLAILAATFYAVSTPLSKLLLQNVTPTFMASFLYFGAGIGIGIVYLFTPKAVKDQSEKLTKKDLPYTLGMILLDIAAPIFLMLGLSSATAANVSLLNNFEIVVTSIIALVIFKEAISARLWFAIVLITAASMVLSFQDLSSLQFSTGSLFVLAACLCWGLENNCTRKISGKSTYEIVILKGLFSGLGSLIISFVISEKMPQIKYVLFALLLGFVAYGLSIFVYIRAQKELGAAKTSAYYAVAPFIGALLSFVILHEALTDTFVAALVIMIAGTALVVMDTLILHHKHLHTHVTTYTHDGTTHNHIIEHSHVHNHMANCSNHQHKHNL